MIPPPGPEWLHAHLSPNLQMLLAQWGQGFDLSIAGLGLVAEEGLTPAAGAAASQAAAEGPAKCLNLQSGYLHFPVE